MAGARTPASLSPAFDGKEATMTQLLTEEDIHARHSGAERIERSALLKPYADIILGVWPEQDIDWRWVATAPEGEIIQWAEDVSDSRRDGIVIEEPVLVNPMDEDWE
jgi:hypothetical protein